MIYKFNRNNQDVYVNLNQVSQLTNTSGTWTLRFDNQDSVNVTEDTATNILRFFNYKS